MKKILTAQMKKEIKEQALNKLASELIICNARRKYDHCRLLCLHGVPHEKEGIRGACHTVDEICKIQKGIVNVRCRPLNKKETKEFIDQERIENNYGRF